MSRACYAVVGTPRSGTSAVAGVLHSLGVPMGERIADPVEERWDFAGPDEWNPRGHFQDAHFGNLEDAEFGPHAPPAGWEPSPRFVAGLQALVRRRCGRGGDWGVKSNRLPFYLDPFRKECGAAGCGVRVVATRRDAARSLASWAARAGDTYGPELIRVASARLSTLAADLVIDYDALFDATASAVAALAAFVGRPVTAEASNHVIPAMRRH